MKSFLILLAVVGQLLVAAPPSQAESLNTVAYEGFDYPFGSLTGRNGGVGWSGPWTGGSPLGVNTTGLTYPGLSVVGGTSTYLTFVNSSNERCLQQPQNSGIVYLQFLSQFSANHGGGTPNIRLLTGGVVTGAIGNNNIPLNNNMAVLDSNLDAVATSSTAIAPNLNFTIVRIDHNADETQIWVNPNLSNFNYFNPPTADATARTFSPSIECILPITRNSGQFDEIKIMSLSVGSEFVRQPLPEVFASISLDVISGQCQVDRVESAVGSWVRLPSANQCVGPSNSTLLGWSTSRVFPPSMARVQVSRGWGVIDTLMEGERVIFVPAGLATRVTGSNVLFPVWG